MLIFNNDVECFIVATLVAPAGLMVDGVG